MNRQSTTEPRMPQPTHVDLAFPVRGQTVAKDHGYALYGALSRVMPSLHGASWIGIHGIAAPAAGPDQLALRRGGTLRVRIPLEHVAALLALAGKQIEVKGQPVIVGPPSIHALEPAEVLDARLVAIKLTGGAKRDQKFDNDEFAGRFIAEAKRQLERVGVVGALELRGRSSFEVGGRRVIGYAVRIRELSQDQSIVLQIAGLGGKRTMGCGLFRPSRPRP